MWWPKIEQIYLRRYIYVAWFGEEEDEWGEPTSECRRFISRREAVRFFDSIHGKVDGSILIDYPRMEEGGLIAAKGNEALRLHAHRPTNDRIYRLFAIDLQGMLRITYPEEVVRENYMNPFCIEVNV